GGIGIVAALLAMLTFLPAVLALFGRVAFWPFRPRYQSHPAEEHGFWGRVARTVGRRARGGWGITTVVLLAMGAGLASLNANGLPLDKSFVTTQDSTTGQKVLGQHFPGGTGSPTVILAKADQLAPVLDAVKHTPGIADAVPYTGVPVGTVLPAGVPQPQPVVAG